MVRLRVRQQAVLALYRALLLVALLDLLKALLTGHSQAALWVAQSASLRAPVERELVEVGRVAVESLPAQTMAEGRPLKRQSSGATRVGVTKMETSGKRIRFTKITGM